MEAMGRKGQLLDEMLKYNNLGEEPQNLRQNPGIKNKLNQEKMGEIELEKERQRKLGEEAEKQNKLQNFERQKQLEEEDDKQRRINELNKKIETGNEQKSLTLDELNILIQGTINELYLPEMIDPIVFNKIIITMKCLSEPFKKLFLRGLEHGIVTQEQQNRYNIILEKIFGNNNNYEGFEYQNDMSPYPEDENFCNCECHHITNMENEFNY